LEEPFDSIVRVLTAKSLISLKFSFCSPNIDGLVKSQKAPVIVIPVKTGIQEIQSRRGGRLPLSREWRPWRLFTILSILAPM